MPFRKYGIVFLLFITLAGCAGFPQKPEEALAERAFPLRYPVILVHGIIAHDRESIFDFWGRIPEKLTENGVIVYFGNTDAWGDIELNSELLKAAIERALQETESEKVNIIAHSKGGLDARYLIWKYDFGDRVASLTTMSTPHRGAELADRFYNWERFDSSILLKNIEFLARMYGDTNPDINKVIYQLTTGQMDEFNETTGMVDDKVYFQSIYTTMQEPSDDVLLSRSFRYIRNISGDNDGVVSEYSAAWGGNVKKIEGRISHLKIVDNKKRKIHGIDIPNIYIDIVRDLYERGF